jgi:CMP-N-acetylneuraminic acid synthetase
MNVLGLITARGGSKGIPRKNLRLICGRPLIFWTIQSAWESQSLQRLVVSTDDLEIADVSREYGAEVPFIRPVNLAMDDSPQIDVVIHAVEWLEANAGYCPDYVMLLQPTSPLRSGHDIDAAVRIAATRNADAVISVTESPAHPYLSARIDEGGRLAVFMERPKVYQGRQSLPPAYAENGAIYLARREVLLDDRTWHTKNTYPYVMSPESSLDIDTPWDLYLANLVLNEKSHELEPLSGGGPPSSGGERRLERDTSADA